MGWEGSQERSEKERRRGEEKGEGGGEGTGGAKRRGEERGEERGRECEGGWGRGGEFNVLRTPLLVARHSESGGDYLFAARISHSLRPTQRPPAHSAPSCPTPSHPPRARARVRAHAHSPSLRPTCVHHAPASPQRPPQPPTPAACPSCPCQPCVRRREAQGRKAPRREAPGCNNQQQAHASVDGEGGGEQQPTAGLRHARQRRGRENNQQHTHAARDEKEGG